MLNMWRDRLESDPFYNPNLSRHYHVSIAFPPRVPGVPAPETEADPVSVEEEMSARVAGVGER